MPPTSTARKEEGVKGSGGERERIKRIGRWMNVLDDIIGTQDNIRGRVAVREKVFRFYRKLAAMPSADRYLVVNGLEETNNDAARTLLERVLLSDTNAIVRHEAAYCLGVVGDDESLSVLRHALFQDNNPLVRHEAALSLAEIGTEDELECLEGGMKDDNHDVVDSCQIGREILLGRMAQEGYQDVKKEREDVGFSGNPGSSDVRLRPRDMAARLLRK